MQDPLQAWRQCVNKKGLKATKQRELIAQTFFRLNEHMTAEDMLHAVRKDDPKVGLATVYRTLKLLQECGLARCHHFDNGQPCFEPNIDAHGQHDHLICTVCGAFVEFRNEDIHALQESVARQHHFRIIRQRMEIYGLCTDCQQTNPSSANLV